MKSSKKPHYLDIEFPNGFGSTKERRLGIWVIIFLCIILLSLDIGTTRANVEVGHGFLKQDSLFPHWFSFDDGTYPYLVGTTNYDLMGTPDQNIIDTIDWQAQFFNVMRVSLRPKRDLWREYNKSPAFDVNDANPFGGTWESPAAGWNARYWERFNAIMEHAAAKGVIIELIICRDAHKEYDILQDSGTFNKFMVETSKHWNLMYNVANEWEENLASSEVKNLANRIKAADPNRHLISVHSLSGYDFWTEPWSDYAVYQRYDVPDGQNSLIRNNWYRNEPQINEEYGYEGRISEDEVLAIHWALAAGGGMGMYGHSPTRLEGWYMIGKGWGQPGVAHTWLGYLRDFMNRRVGFWKMRGDNSKIKSGTGWALVEEGKEYVVVLPQGGAVTVDLSVGSGSLNVEWLNAKTGQIVAAGTTNGGGSRSFTPPGPGLWVLHIFGGIASDSTPPTVPQSVNALTKSEFQIDLTWQPSSDPESGISTYRIYRNSILIAQSSLPSFSDTGLSEATSYTYEVSAVNGAGLESEKSAPVTGTTKADTTPPLIVSVSANEAPTKVTIIFSEPVEQNSASDINNYHINNGITISGAALGSDLKTVTLTTNSQTEGITYTLTVNNIKDRAKTPNTIAPNTQRTYSFVAQLMISNLTAASGKTYQVVDGGLQVGALVYIDRSFTFTYIPASLVGATYIKTANDDKASTGSSFLSFDVNQPVTVYLAHDNRITSKPSWLGSFTDTGTDLSTSDTTSSIFKKDLSAGNVTLGGNEGGDNSMYGVIIVGKGGSPPSDTIPPAAPIGLRIQ